MQLLQRPVRLILLVMFLLTACTSPAAAPQPTSDQRTQATPTASGAVPTAAGVVLLPSETPPDGAERSFRTDFTRHSVPYSEIRSGGPPKDGIPSIDNPQFVSVAEAAEWLHPREPVVRVQVGSEIRAYPIQILIWHEIVNDTVAGVPLVVTFCPLCNTAIVFEREIAGQLLDFGTTGRLRRSNLIMYDRQTESWWQQATGEAIAGAYTGSRLVFRTTELIAWDDFQRTHPDGQVLSRETGFTRSYGRNPYLGYDSVDSIPFLYDGPTTPGQLAPLARVLTIDLNGEAVAYPYELLRQRGVLNDRVGELELAVFWVAGAVSPFSGDPATGDEVGAAAAFARQLDGQLLSFVSQDGRIIDEQTGSSWDGLGNAIAGPLQGRSLTPVVAINHFWFSWAAFRPETRVATGE